MINKFNVKEEVFTEGKIFERPTFCKNKFNDKCLRHYKEHPKDVLVKCPYGFSTYFDKNLPYIFTGIVLEKDSKDKKIIPKIKGDKNLTIIKEKQLDSLIKELTEQKKLISTDDFIATVMHEMRKLNNIMRNNVYDSIESLDVCLSLQKKNNLDDIKKRLLSAESACDLISSRIKTYDYWKNPYLLESKKEIFGVFQKFQKASHILELVSKGRIAQFKGGSHSKIKASNTFEILPFIFLENAIKYSPKGKKVEVEFKEMNKTLFVTIKNEGPFVEEKEIESLFHSGYRSKNAVLLSEQSLEIEGYGLGLYIANEICNNNNIKLTVTSNKSTKFKRNKIDYSYFIVTLEFDI